MLPTPNRLPTPLVKQVMRSGRRLTSPDLTFIYRSNTASTPRFAVVVPKHVDNRAVVRNRTKRLVREALRKLLPEMKQGVDGVIIVHKRLPSLQETIESIKGLVLRV